MTHWSHTSYRLMRIPAYLLIVTSFACGIQAAPQRFEYSQVAMGVRARIVLYAKDEATAKQAASAAFDRVATLEDIMSDYRPTSELMRLCEKAGGPPVKVSPELLFIFTKSQELSRRSGGAFDVTVGPMVRLWRTARKSGGLPTSAEISAAQSLVGWRKMTVLSKASTVKLVLPGMKLDLGGIAKGYACDEAIRVLKQQGIKSTLVEMGGDIAVSNPPPGTKGWEIEIAGKTMTLSNKAVSSSGDTEQFVEIGGKRYSHIVDSKTGLGLTNRIAVTIIAPNGVTSDGLSTAVSVLGDQKGKALAMTYPGVQAYIRKASDPTVFPKSPPPAKTLLHANLLESPDDLRLAVTVLQGLVNRQQPRIYITQNPGWHTPEVIPKWIEGLKGRGYSFTEVADSLSLFATFRSSIKGAVLYEPNLEGEALHKINALTLYCSLHNAVLVTESLNAKLKLPVLLDARGKFNTAGEAYKWAYEELWPSANHGILALTCPSHIVLRDYLVANKIMPFWISQGTSKAEEDIVMRFVDEARPNSPVMGCWGGYGEKPPGRISESELQRLLSERGKFIIVTDGCFNLTVHSGLQFKRPEPRPTKGLLLEDKVYLCFNFTDGDNLQYIQQYFRTRQWWDDPNRGKVPISWSLNPAMAELMPDVLEYFLSTRTPNGEFVCSTAGIGLVTPSLYPTDAYKDYISLTRQAINNAGLTAIHLGDTSGIPWTEADFDKWAKGVPEIKGIIADYGPAPGVNASNATILVNGKIPVVRAFLAPGSSAPNDQSAQVLADAIRAVTPANRPAFIHVCCINWFNSPTVVMDAVKMLGEGYVPVLPSQMFELIGEMRGKPPPDR